MMIEVPPATGGKPPTGGSNPVVGDNLPNFTPATNVAVVRRTLRRLTLAITAAVLLSIPALFALDGSRALR